MIEGVIVNRPRPVFAAASNSFTAVGGVAAAGIVSGYVIEFVGFVQVPPARQELATDAIDEADVESVWVPAC